MSFLVNFLPSSREKLVGSLTTSLNSNYINFANLSRSALCADMVYFCGP